MYKLSVSKAKTFESCQKKFEYQYVIKMRPLVDFPFFAFGKMLHQVLEDFHKALLEDPLMDHSKFMGKAFKKAWLEFGCELTSDNQKECYDIIDAYLRLVAEEKNPPTIIGVERNFSVEIDGVARIVGMIDRIQVDTDGVVHVIDYKSSKSMKYYEDDMFQLMVYAFILMKEDESMQRIRGSYMFLKHQFAMITREFSRDEIMKIGPQIVEYAKKMQEETEFKPNPSFLCNYCAYQPACTEGKMAMMRKVVKTGKSNWE